MGSSLIAIIMVTPIHPASYTTLMTIIAADIRTPIVAVPMAIIPIGTVIAVIAIGTVIAVAVPVAAVIFTAIGTPMMSAMNASNATGC
jgi:uncharacterized membrane protein